jgi:hypothetical protein
MDGSLRLVLLLTTALMLGSAILIIWALMLVPTMAHPTASQISVEAGWMEAGTVCLRSAQ